MESIKGIIADILKIPVNEVTDHTSIESNPLWDSLSHLEIIYALEKKFSLTFTGNEIVEITSIQKIKEILFKKIGANLET